MSDHLTGVATLIQKEEPKAVYVHCVAHSLCCACKTVQNNVHASEML